MERIVKISKTLRNNWKKSIVGAFALYYGASMAKEKVQVNILMRAACKEAMSYGDKLIPMERNPTMITVILNPVANKRKAKRDFEKYCEPLLHLAGLQVDVVNTTSEGHAKEIVETLRGTEAIIVAGGDGTLSETVTGLLRRNDDANQFPLGVLPLGQSNTLANTMFPGGKGVDRVQQLVTATMAIIKGSTEWKDAIKIEPVPEEGETPGRPIFALTTLEWGAFRDTMARKDKYWFLGPLRKYATYIFNGYKNSVTWDCKGTIKYTPPCAGCSNCVVKKPEVKRKWSFFMPKTPQLEQVKVENPECSATQELCFKTSEFKIITPNIEKSQEIPALNIVLGKNNYTYTEFVAEGWNRIKNHPETRSQVIPARTIELLPEQMQQDVVIEIDKEDFDVKPLKITLLPAIVKLFCTPQIKVNY